MSNKQSIKFRLVLLDGNEVTWDSGITELGIALKTVKTRMEYEVGDTIYFRHSVFSAELLNAET